MRLHARTLVAFCALSALIACQGTCEIKTTNGCYHDFEDQVTHVLSYVAANVSSHAKNFVSLCVPDNL
jgi:hypothetical protein